METTLTSLYPLTARDLNSYGYCQRFIYWIHVRKAKRANTKKMQLGNQYHNRYLARAKPNTRTITNIYLHHKKLNFSGIIDLLEIMPQEIILHEVKFTKPPMRIPLNDYLQLLGQAILVEHNFKAKVNNASITYPRGITLAVPLPRHKEQIVSPILKSIREIIHNERLLPPTPASQKCQDCEYFRICKRA